MLLKPISLMDLIFLVVGLFLHIIYYSWNDHRSEKLLHLNLCSLFRTVLENSVQTFSLRFMFNSYFGLESRLSSSGLNFTMLKL